MTASGAHRRSSATAQAGHLPSPPNWENSRDSLAGAGWGGTHEDLSALLPPALQDEPPFSWLRLKSLTGGRRNDPLAKLLGDPSHERRQAWLNQTYGDDTPELTIDRTDLDTPSFLLLGDTGEGDISQYAPMSIIDSLAPGTDFMVICSDVIYPAGGTVEYAYKHSWPYRHYPRPIYALPGNHDWYDSLRGFMAYFCGQTSVPPRPHRSLLSRAGLLDRLWLDESEPDDPCKRQVVETLRQDSAQHARLPGPYYRISTGPLDLIAIDTGIDGTIDATQGDWLRHISRSPKPKVLLTGKPIYVNGRHQACPIDGGRQGTVDDIVRDPAHRYLAAIGGDVHNYQRYPVQVGSRTIQYLVSGGGGAYMHPTHKIPNIDKTPLAAISESSFRCYPLRGDSLSFYSQLYNKKFPGSWYLTPAEAAAYLADRLGITPAKENLPRVPVSRELRRRGSRVFPLPGQLRGPWHMLFAEFFDWNDPPLFKHVLHLTCSDTELSISCLPATGCIGPRPPKPEDQVVCRFDRGDRWT
jgi:Calcineurin-like phosphoesterase